MGGVEEETWMARFRASWCFKHVTFVDVTRCARVHFGEHSLCWTYLLHTLCLPTYTFFPAKNGMGRAGLDGGGRTRFVWPAPPFHGRGLDGDALYCRLRILYRCGITLHQHSSITAIGLKSVKAWRGASRVLLATAHRRCSLVDASDGDEQRHQRLWMRAVGNARQNRRRRGAACIAIACCCRHLFACAAAAHRLRWCTRASLAPRSCAGSGFCAPPAASRRPSMGCNRFFFFFFFFFFFSAISTRDVRGEILSMIGLRARRGIFWWRSGGV